MLGCIQPMSSPMDEQDIGLVGPDEGAPAAALSVRNLRGRLREGRPESNAVPSPQGQRGFLLICSMLHRFSLHIDCLNA